MNQEVGSLKSFAIDNIKNERKEIKRKHDIDYQDAIDKNIKDYDFKLNNLQESLEVQELHKQLQLAIKKEQLAKIKLKKEKKENSSEILEKFKELERKRLEQYDIDEVMMISRESSSLSSSWITCKHCYMPFDKNIKKTLKCEQLQPNLDQCPNIEDERSCGCNLIRCNRCQTMTCSECQKLHNLLCVCRCGMWEGDNNEVEYKPLNNPKGFPSSCQQLLPVWYVRSNEDEGKKIFVVNHHLAGCDNTCFACNVVFCDDCVEIHLDFVDDSEKKCYKQLTGRCKVALDNVKRYLPSYKDQQLSSLQDCLLEDEESDYDDNDDDDNDDDNDDDDDDDDDNNNNNNDDDDDDNDDNSL